jgi:predicted enzyme related to lactoylglutathione lyase
MSSGNKTPEAGTFCWNELMTSSPSSAKEFYGTLFGWQSNDVPMENMTYTLFNMGETQIGGMMQIPADKKGQIPPHWMSYISVKNVEETLEKAQSLGATILVPPTQAGDVGRFAIIQDPQGASVAFWQSLKSC